ncbi:MAG: glycosyltransferase family 2 protein [Bacteroidales bacterium]|nr:glycosyltransferase family 2 protein [Bacteroidales bacterium]
MQTLSLIIPCFNEAEVIESSYVRLKMVMDGLTDVSPELIFVNDGSRDQTGEILSAIAQKDSRVTVLHFSRNFGHQPAVAAGIHHCKSDLAIIMDADLQDPPELIPAILEKQKQEKASVIYCVRQKRDGVSFMKNLSYRLFYRSLNMLSEVSFPLDTGDFRLIDRQVMDEFNRFREKNKYIRGIISWVGFKQVPFFYERDARFAGVTKYPFRKLLHLAGTAMLYFSKKPLKVAIGLGFTAVVIGLLYGLWILMGKIFGYTNAESGWSSIILLVIFFGGVQLLTVGVLGQYIGIIFDEVKDRPEYIVEKEEKYDSELS